MRSLNVKIVMPLLVMLAMLLGAVSGSAHDGHDHGAPPTPVSTSIAPRTEASSSDFEIVLIARGAELIVHLDAFQTNNPVLDAVLEIDAPAGTLKPLAKGGGVYAIAAPFLAKPGSYDLAITVTANGSVDILAATLKIPEATVGARATRSGSWFTEPAIAGELKQRIAGSGVSLWLVLVVGFVAGLAVAGLLWRRTTRAGAVGVIAASMFLLPASQVRADSPPAGIQRDLAQRFADGALFVPKQTQHILALRTQLTEQQVHRRAIELPGRIVPSPNASGLVQASVGGRLSPPTGGFKPLGTPVKAGDILAYVRQPLPLADATAQQQQARELDQQISIVSRRVDRYRILAASQSVARSQLEDAETELKGLRTRRANLDRVQREPEALLAPVAGIIASSNAVAGQMAEPNSVIFQIIDPKVLWIEALSYEAHATSGAARAVLADGRAVDLDYLGTGFADRNQAVPIHFAIRSDTTGLRVGQFVTVLAATADERSGLAVPREAVLRGGNGQALVYEHTNAERFIAREVRVEPLDGTQVLIVAGIEPGRRVVTQGAELLNQIR